MAIKRITFSAGTGVYLPKTAVIKNIIYTGEASVDSDCLDIDNEETLACYSFVICQSNQIRAGLLDAAGDGIPALPVRDNERTDNWEHLVYEGLIINGEQVPFSSPISISIGAGNDVNDTDHAEERFTSGITNLVNGFSTLSLYTQGLIRDVCAGAYTDDNYDMDGLFDAIEELSGVCGSISFKAPESIMTDARIYGYMDSFNDINMPFQFPIYTDTYVSETIGQPTCGCA